MKKLMLLLLVLMSFHLQARVVNQCILLRSPMAIDTVLSEKKLNQPIYILNGKKESLKKISKIDTVDIVEFTASRDKKNKIYSTHKGLDTIFILTRKFAADTYKRRFSKLSAGYKQYLQEHNNDDSDVVYRDGGVILKNNSKGGITELYYYTDDLIKNVQFDENGSAEHGPLVTIIQIF